MALASLPDVEEQLMVPHGPSARSVPGIQVRVTERADDGGGEHPPLIILAPPRSYTSLVCAMLGQHPQLYGLPELHLFMADTVAGWWKICDDTPWRAHGALRTVAELYFGGQTEETVKKAEGWLRRRSQLSTGELFRRITRIVSPRVAVEKSPSTTYTLKRLERVQRAFPAARYIHLVRHPRTQAESMIRLRERKEEAGRHVGQYWADPPLAWYECHRNISRFLDSVGERRHIRIRAEDFLSDPHRVGGSVAEWLGVRTDAEAIDAVKHPERSPFARLGPPGARFGNDGNFLRDPVFRAGAVRPSNLEDPLSWRPNGEGFAERVKQLARQFGYE
jgi:Sulfotransferase family